MNTRSRAAFPDETTDDGSFNRQQSAFRDWVTADGSSGYPAAAGRYHLYVSLACPWASRALTVRMLKGLEDAIGLTVVDPVRDERGWRFGDGTPANGDPDPLNGWEFLSEAYAATDPDWHGRYTVPVLWDKKEGRIVNNESADIIRMLNSEFNAFARNPELDLYPAGLREEIDRINDRVYETLNNGVYMSGFASTQEAYDAAVYPLFDTLDWMEDLLSSRRYLAGDEITEADWRAFMTLVRFDAVYVTHFKCNIRRVIDYPNIWAYSRELYQWPGVAELVNFDHIKRHYFVTHTEINPFAIVPAGPQVDWTEPPGRD